MKDNNSLLVWSCLGKSVRGFSHLKHDLPNQDAIAYWRPEESTKNLPIILAISDGHGSAKSFRSDIGSQMAVEASLKIFRENLVDGIFNSTEEENPNFSLIKDIAKNHLPQRIVREWHQLVEQHLNENEITQQEWELLETRDSTNTKNLIQQILEERNQQNPSDDLQYSEKYKFSLIYGATLLTVMVTDAFILYLQIGDGDIITVKSNGDVQRPLVKDKRLIANETTSLCTEKAWEQFQVELEIYTDNMSEESPKLILLATDGYSNSYSTEEGFFKVGQDYREMISQRGLTYVENNLESFLSQTSEQGSGDDITLGLIKQLEAGDYDYVRQLSQEVEEIRENMNTQTENLQRIDEKLKKLENREIPKLKQQSSWAARLSLIGFFLGFSVPWLA